MKVNMKKHDTPNSQRFIFSDFSFKIKQFVRSSKQWVQGFSASLIWKLNFFFRILLVNRLLICFISHLVLWLIDSKNGSSFVSIQIPQAVFEKKTFFWTFKRNPGIKSLIIISIVLTRVTLYSADFFHAWHKYQHFNNTRITKNKKFFKYFRVMYNKHIMKRIIYQNILWKKIISELINSVNCHLLSNAAPGIVTETHETPFCGSILKRTKDMKQIHTYWS